MVRVLIIISSRWHVEHQRFCGTEVLYPVPHSDWDDDERRASIANMEFINTPLCLASFSRVVQNYFYVSLIDEQAVYVSCMTTPCSNRAGKQARLVNMHDGLPCRVPVRTEHLRDNTVVARYM